MLDIEEAQPLPQPLGILDDVNRERAEPAHRVGRKPERGFQLDQVAQARQQRHAAEHRYQDPGLRHHGEGAAPHAAH